MLSKKFILKKVLLNLSKLKNTINYIFYPKCFSNSTSKVYVFCNKKNKELKEEKNKGFKSVITKPKTRKY